MHLIDGKAIARGMVKVESGEDLVESLQALAEAAGWRDALVTGAGSFELVELRTADGTTVTLENAEITSLAGRIHRGPEGTPLVALQVSVAVPSGIQTGRVTGAMTGGLLLAVDAVVGDGALSRPARVASRTDPSPAGPSFDAPAVPGPAALPFADDGGDGERAATKPLSQSFTTKPVVRPIAGPKFGLDDDEHENPIVNAGDLLEHPQLGVCEVVGEDASGGIKIRLASGKTRVLRLEALHVEQGEEDDEGRVVFKVAGPRRR